MSGKHSLRKYWIAGFCFCVSPFFLLAEPASAQSAEKKIDFNKDVLPIFKAQCTSCHGASEPDAKLNLTTYESTMKGGVSKNIVVKNKSAQSLLVKRIVPGGTAPIMPAGAPPLKASQIATIKKWIDQGAKKKAQ